MKVRFGDSNQLQNGITRVYVGVLCVSLNKICPDMYIATMYDQEWRLPKLILRLASYIDCGCQLALG